MEITVAAMILGLTVLLATAIFPLSHFLQDRSGSYSRASAILQRKMEQVRVLEPSQTHYDGLRSAGIIDAGAAGNTHSFTATDQVSAQLLEGTGTVTLTNPQSDLVRVDVEVRWKGTRGMENRVAAMTYLADKSVWREP